MANLSKEDHFRIPCAEATVSVYYCGYFTTQREILTIQKKKISIIHEQPHHCS